MRHCHRCGARSKLTTCRSCQTFQKHYPGFPFYVGEIKAGDRFDAHWGFVWANEGGNVVMYVETKNGGRKETIPIEQFRARCATRTENKCGSLLFGAFQEAS